MSDSNKRMSNQNTHQVLGRKCWNLYSYEVDRREWPRSHIRVFSSCINLSNITLLQLSPCITLNIVVVVGTVKNYTPSFQFHADQHLRYFVFLFRKFKFSVAKKNTFINRESLGALRYYGNVWKAT